ncbi:MAG: U32 family peptidase [Lachnospiraceae bacterium]|nr:U32 family peptidase [Lachnospiraceae bacterium]
MESAEDKREMTADGKTAACKGKRGQPQSSAALSVNGGCAAADAGAAVLRCAKGPARKLPELLAPAGEAAAVRGAVTAGADAVYLGAGLFSARAYAKNLTESELFDALDYVHLFGKKLYLACNTLIRTRELEAVFAIVDPLYERGLDGVILQDLGLLSLFSQRYPALPLHASTQMSILSAAGVEWLKKKGVCRVVPGRELSLEEIREIKKCGLELECFIHGAMCYSYSGRCLFSSMAGGRSGNRGRCAGPCRQPYHCRGKESCYPLSMKDMCSLEVLDRLVEAGVDSLKIEGRMKTPEYSAGVTELYRKYLDRCAAGEPYRVEKADLERLEGLYLRSGRQEGYLDRHNGREMISLSDPAYAKVSEEEKDAIRSRLIDGAAKKPLQAYIRVKAGEELLLSLSCDEAEVSLSGAVAEPAKKRPLAEAEILRQIRKTGDTPFVIEELTPDCDENSFVPLAELNALRRDALDKMSEALRAPLKREPVSVSELRDPVFGKRSEKTGKSLFLAGLAGEGIDPAKLMERDFVDGLILPPELYFAYAGRKLKGKKLFLRLPPVLRQKHLLRVRDILKAALENEPDGIYCDSLDTLAAAAGFFPKEKLRADRGIYVFNPAAQELLLKEAATYTASAELAGKEALSFAQRDRTELVVYGRTPLMYSANCVFRTLFSCDHDARLLVLQDEKGHGFPVRPDHEYCFNTLYNCVPLSLHRELAELAETGAAALRIEFSVEKEEEALRILDGYTAWLSGGGEEFLPEGASSRGHYRKGAE